MSHIKYRPEIDGLRTLAVLSVIIYHADFFIGKTQILSGGFFGVDIFFVISGFLITSLITKELHTTGKFSFINFYDRRIRRLFPALLFIILCSFPLAWLFFLPDSFIDFSKSIIASIVFISNIYWYDSLQIYGAEASNLKPFLHTWSLAVEEQYYLLFPIIMIVGFKWFKTHLITILTILTIVSIQFAEIMSIKDSSFSFYLIFSRFWELLIGSLLAYTLHIHPKKENDHLLTKIMPAIGLYLIVYAIIFISYDDSNHPGFITLLPVMGSVLIIWFSNKNEIITKILSSKLLVGVGLISYSLYLWHFPVFSFLRIEGEFNSLGFKFIAIAVVFILSIISYKVIEKPFRSKDRVSARIFYFLMLLITTIILFLSYLIIVKDGYPDRFKGALYSSAKEMNEYRIKYWGEKSAYTKITDFSADKVSIRIIGNSWAQDIANSLIETSNFEVNYQGSTSHQCKAITLNALGENHKEFNKREKGCPKNITRFQAKLKNTELVIIADHRQMQNIQNKAITNAVLKNSNELRKSGYKGPILIISNRPTFKKNIFDIFKEYGASGDGINHYAQKYLNNSISKMNKEDIDADNFYSKNKIYYYSPVNYFCQNNICKISHKGAPLYHDRGHLTLSGTRFFGDDLTQFIKVNILNKSLNGNEDNYLMPMKKGLDIKTSNELIVDINSSEFSNDKYKKHEGKALGMYWNGSITSPTYNQNKGEYNLKVNAKGSKAGDVFAKLNIQIYKISNKGKHSLITENTIKSSNEFKHYSTNFELIEPSNIFFKISFINNKKTHSEKGDRNIWLKSITLTRN